MATLNTFFYFRKQVGNKNTNFWQVEGYNFFPTLKRRVNMVPSDQIKCKLV